MAEASCSTVQIRGLVRPFEPPAYDESARVGPDGNVLVDLGGGSS